MDEGEARQGAQESLGAQHCLSHPHGDPSKGSRDILLPHWERGAAIACGPTWSPAHREVRRHQAVRRALLPPPALLHTAQPSSRAQRQAARVPAALTCLVFFLPKFLIYMSYSFTGGRSKKENVNEKSRSMSRSNFVLRVLENKLETDKVSWQCPRVCGRLGETESLSGLTCQCLPEAFSSPARTNVRAS